MTEQELQPKYFTQVFQLSLDEITYILSILLMKGWLNKFSTSQLKDHVTEYFLCQCLRPRKGGRGSRLTRVTICPFACSYSATTYLV